MYATSLPLLPIIGMFSFFFQLWVDKFMFCNLYRTPPRYSDSMGKTSLNLIGVAVVIHLVMSIWALGSGTIFQRNVFDLDDALSNTPNGDYSSDDSTGIWMALPPFVRQPHVIILEVLLIMYLLVALLSAVSSHWYQKLMQLIRCLCCFRGSTDAELKSTMNVTQISYSRACKKGTMKGLETYNILANPKYMQAFGISKEFASNHKNLSSIRGFNTKETLADV
jgi:hypothetical protein